MARGKKKESTLTPEEKLAQALVPDWEHPYKVPKNWQWVVLKSCCIDFFSGKSPKYSKVPTDIKIIGQQANRRDGIDLSYVKFGTVEFAEAQEERMWLRKNDVLLNTLGSGTIGRSGIYKGNERLLTDGHLFVFRSNECYLPDLMYYYLCANEEKIINSANGSTNQKFLSLSSFSTFPLPVPPIAEQQRIVDRIEYLFAKLDEAKEKAQSVLDGFETRKAAILHKAFTGELTAKWRSTHFLGSDTWSHLRLKDICDYMKAGGDKPLDFVDERDAVHCIPVVANGISNDGIIGYSAESKYDGETVTVSGRGTIGYSIYRNYPYYPVVRLIVLGPKKNIDAKFLKYAFDAFPEEGTGSSIPQLTVPMIKEKLIPVPCVEEQKEIVRIIDSIFAKEQQAKEAAEAVLEKIDLLKKSILARAFRGELGTNDPTEESAIELLKGIL